MVKTVLKYILTTNNRNPKLGKYLWDKKVTVRSKSMQLNLAMMAKFGCPEYVRRRQIWMLWIAISLFLACIFNLFKPKLVIVKA